MSYSALQNSPISVNLITACNETGWSVDGTTASHVSCNSGSIVLLGYTLTSGQTYNISYAVTSISSGYVCLVAGTTQGIHRTTPGFYNEQITANGQVLSFFSNGTCAIQTFNIQAVIVDNSNYTQNTVVYSVNNHKWGEFRTIAPDYGFSLGIDMFTVYKGALYRHENGSDDRNTFYGIPYQSIVQYVDATAPTISKTYQSLSIQSNQLIVTSPMGISTSLGQISELASVDFVKDYLSDANSNVAIQTIEGVFSANFLRDANVNLLEGDVLRGNYMVIELTSTQNTPLRLFTVNIVSRYSPIGAR